VHSYLLRGMKIRPPRMSGSYMVIELSNRCNLSCVHCAVSEDGHPHHIETGYISISMVENLMDDLIENQIHFDTLILFWLGEPTIHPHFTTIYRLVLRAASRHQIFSNIELHTNGIRLKEGINKTLLNHANVRQSLHITIDANKEATYHKIKGRDQLQQVVENTKSFLSSKASLESTWPRVVLQYIVGSNNSSEVGSFVSDWHTFITNLGLKVRSSGGHVPQGDDVILFFRQLDCPTVEQQSKENQIFEDTMRHHGIEMAHPPSKSPKSCTETLQPCSGFWKSPVIYWDGQLTVCTRDNEMKNTIGTIATTPFSKLWWGSLQEKRRNSVALGDYSTLELCQTCFIPQSLNHTDISDTEIKESQSYTQREEHETGSI
jgi:sulfatase maturation enzyme AslB (radical SAM superfamily)